MSDNEKWLEDFGVRLIDEGEKVLPPYTALGDFDLLKGRFQVKTPKLCNLY